MKIYFEDYELQPRASLPFHVDLVIEAGRGVSQNIDALDITAKMEPNAVVYTNSIFAFSNQYAWNEKLKAPEVYIRAGEHMVFTRIDELTTKELRESHNLAKMYVAGVFSDPNA